MDAAAIQEGEQLWQEALGELALQMTRGTFDAQLRGTHCIGQDGDDLIIAVPNTYALEWLENRLDVVVTRVLHTITGNGVRARYVVESSRIAAGATVSGNQEKAAESVESQVARLLNDPAARRLLAEALGVTTAQTDARWVAPAFDEARRWFPLHEYCAKFWGAYLGARAFRLWEVVRKHDTRREKTAWTPARRFSVPALAREVGCGRQAIAGVDRRVDEGTAGAFIKRALGIDGAEGEPGWYIHQVGALDRLVEAGVAEVHARGSRRQRLYEVSVRVVLGWLEPGQLAEMDAELQSEHWRWIEESGEDPGRWQ